MGILVIGMANCAVWNVGNSLRVCYHSDLLKFGLVVVAFEVFADCRGNNIQLRAIYNLKTVN